MGRLLLLPLPGNEGFAARLAAHLDAEVGELEMRRFPDGESYVRIATDVAGRRVAVVCSLHEPDAQFLPLVFAGRVAADLGAVQVGLVAPYLAYMRQDCRFRPGEAVSSVYFAELVSRTFSWLVTVDPHLHRWKSLDEIYALRSRVVAAAPAIGDWIGGHVERPLLIGPDCESRQWVSAVAGRARAPFVVLEKTRHGDREVSIELGDIRIDDHTPVLVDDIISTAHTMIEVVKQWRARGWPAPVCIGVHGLFADAAYGELVAAGAARIVTTNTVPHATSEIDLSAAVADAVGEVA